MAGRRVHFVMPAELVERIDELALVLSVSRGELVRRAVEAYISLSVDQKRRTESFGPRSDNASLPAEQPDREAALRGAYEVAAKGGLVGELFQQAADAAARAESRRHAPSCKCPVCS